MLRLKEKKCKKTNKFLPEEDERLKQVIAEIGTRNWVTVASMMPGRNVRQCIERWRRINKKIKPKRPWTQEEDEILLEKYQIYGKKWGKIVPFLTNRNESSIRIRFHQLNDKTSIDYQKTESPKQEKPIQLAETIHPINPVIEDLEMTTLSEALDFRWWNQSSEFQFF